MKKILATGLLIMASSAQANLIDNWQFTNDAGARTFEGWTKTHGAPLIIGLTPEVGFFHGGRSVSYSRIEQTISLADAGIYMRGVDHGGYNYDLSAWFNSHAGKDDARLGAYFYNEAGQSLGSRLLGWYQYTNWTYREVMGALPELTRNVKIVLESSRDYGSDNNGYIHTPSFDLSVNSVGTSMGLNSIYASNVPVGGMLSGLGLLALGAWRRRAVVGK